MALNFPNSPSNGDVFVASNGVTYEFDGVHDYWIVQEHPPNVIANASLSANRAAFVVEKF